MPSAMPSARLGVQGTLGPPSERSSARFNEPDVVADRPHPRPPAIMDRISVISTVLEILASNA